jgi:uncharacterized SAM-binding protein YcdF (DUF218 family)
MVYCGLPSRPVTTRWRRLGLRTVGVLDGARAAVGIALVVDAFRSFFTPDVSLLGLFVRWPGGATLPAWDGLLLGAAFLVRRRASGLVLVAHLVLAALNVAEFYVLRAGGLPAAALPFSLLSAGLLAAALARLFYDGPAGRRVWTLAGAAASAPFFILLHLFSFGSTDYARPAEAVVVFGAGVSPDGTPSLALEDRVRHGVRLWHRGIAPVLVLSGGPDETPVMRRLAAEQGVPEEAIELDPAGVNTFATLKNLRARKVVAVSHYYHLARIKLAAGRLGLACATVPCAMTRRLEKEPWYLARECAAFAGYYLFRG